MNETTTTGAYCYDTKWCWHRLPCGICTMTNQPCPMSPQTVQVTWTSTTGGTNDQR